MPRRRVVPRCKNCAGASVLHAASPAMPGWHRANRGNTGCRPST